MKKLLVAIVLMLAMVAPNVSYAKGFGGGSFGGGSRSSFSSGSSSFSSSRSSSFSSGSSSRSSSYSSSSSRPKVNLSKSSSSKGSFSGGSSSYNKAYSASAKKTITSGSFSGRTSTKSTSYRTGSVYRSTPTRVYYGGHYVTVSHYYSGGFYHPFGYYDGFTAGMIMSSFYHPWGGVYPVNGVYTQYGPSPLAWVADIIGLIVLIIIGWVIVKAVRRPKATFTRKF